MTDRRRASAPPAHPVVPTRTATVVAAPVLPALLHAKVLVGVGRDLRRCVTQRTRRPGDLAELCRRYRRLAANADVDLVEDRTGTASTPRAPPSGRAGARARRPRRCGRAAGRPRRRCRRTGTRPGRRPGPEPPAPGADRDIPWAARRGRCRTRNAAVSRSSAASSVTTAVRDGPPPARAARRDRWPAWSTRSAAGRPA